MEVENISSLIKPGQEIVMTGWAGIEGTSIIANKKQEDLLTRFTNDFVNRAKDLINSVLVLEEASIDTNMKLSQRYYISEGGVFAALWDIAKASSIGLEVDISKIPIKQETIEVCELYDINPYELASSGSMLFVTEQGNSLVASLHAKEINAAIIGKITCGNKKLIINGDYKRFLTPSKKDELYKI